MAALAWPAMFDELVAVVADVGDLVGHDQVMLRVDGGLHVVADDAAARARWSPWTARPDRSARSAGPARRARPASRALNACICSRKRGDLLLQPDGLGLRQLALLAVGRLQRRHVALDAGLDLLHPLLQLGLGEVLVPGVHRLELAAVDRRHGVGEQVQLAGTAR